MEENKPEASQSVPWPEKYSDKAVKLLKQSLTVFGIIILISFISFGFEYFFIIPFLLFLYTFLIGITSLGGLIFQKPKRRYYIQSITTVVFSFSLIFFHIYAGHQIIRGHTTSAVIAKRIVCSANLKILGSQCIKHTSENSWSSIKSWCDILETSDLDIDDFMCPIDKTGPCSYAINENIPADANELPDDLVLLFESTPGWNQTGGPDDVVTDRHGENNPGANIAFADGHVEFIPAEDIPALRWTMDE